MPHLPLYVLPSRLRDEQRKLQTQNEDILGKEAAIRDELGKFFGKVGL